MIDNQELQTAWDFVENTGTSIFLTGKAGTGKTTFLHRVVEKSKKRIVIVAPTGVAAMNAGGVTIHSFFQLPLSPFVPEAQMHNRYDFNKEKKKIIRTLDLLIIDEISMVRSDLLDAIDSVLRRFRDHTLPFGGVQLLLIGDLQQLTPVVTPEDERILRPYYDTPYFFSSHALRSVPYVTIQLTKVFRQSDERFIKILNNIRDGQPSSDDFQVLNNRVISDFHPNAKEGYIRLTTHNRLADAYNEGELNRLNTELYSFHADIKDDFPEYNYPTDETLTLKVGAQIMFLKNDNSEEHQYFNGKIGHVVYLAKDRIEVQCPGDDFTIDVEPEVWENTKYKLNEETKEIESEVMGTFKQYPLRLAWAITIHKSQGLTFEHAIIDAAQSFASGQVYVALSRCKSLEGLVLTSPIQDNAIIRDGRVFNFISQQEVAAAESIRQLPTLREEYFRYQVMDLFDFRQIAQMQEHLQHVVNEFFFKFPKICTLHKIQLQNFDKLNTIAKKWLHVIWNTPVDKLHDEDFLERIKRSADYFSTEFPKIFSVILTHTKGLTSTNKTAMKRLDNSYSDLQESYDSKLALLREMSTQTFSIADYMHAKQHTLLDAIETQEPETKKKKRKTTESKPKTPKPDTKQETLKLFKQGLSPKEIANMRKLTSQTIIGHLAYFVSLGEISSEKLISPKHRQQVLLAIQNNPEGGNRDIKAACPEDITYGDIAIVRAELKSKDTTT